MPETDGGMAFRLQFVRHNQHAIVVRCDYFAIAVPADDGASFFDQLHPRIVVGPVKTSLLIVCGPETLMYFWSARVASSELI